MCCEKLRREIINGRFKKDESLFIVFQTSDYDEDYGYAVFKHKLRIDYCPFCGEKY